MRVKLTLIGLAATLVMAFASHAATARNLSISHGELFTAEWRQLRFESGGLTATECDVTLEGSFHYRTILKVRESLVGYITRAISNNCRVGSATVLTSNLPWHIRYRGFESFLPAISAIRLSLILVEFRIHEPIFGTECPIKTTTERPAVMAARLSAGSEGRTVIALTADPTARIPCFVFEGGFNGSATVREGFGRAENLLVRLI
jgi:hypothetical protein